MSYVAITDPKFLGTLETWFLNQKEILVMTRYSHAAGSREFEFFSSFSDLSARLRQLPRLAYATAFKRRQLPLRGVVDDGFITKCLATIPDDSEYLVVETVRRVYGSRSWFHNG